VGQIRGQSEGVLNMANDCRPGSRVEFNKTQAGLLITKHRLCFSPTKLSFILKFLFYHILKYLFFPHL